ncbi:hypothetical protein [Streptomyces sp. SID5614]|uniref:hypothetical protein n=1 Tax=Streptomyces sp. SID5614 TaxID=2690306 RepID=UPI00136D5DD3|nr:hypothetical protein [Streptomyces sp. SID5614]
MLTSPPDLALQGLAHVGETPLLCAACGSGYALRIYKRGPREPFPASVSCLGCGHWEDCSPVLTNGMVDAALEARTGRKVAADIDTFVAEWRGRIFQGELVAEFIPDDAVVMLKALHGEVSKDARRWWGGKKRAVRTRAKETTGAVKAAAKEKAGGAAGAAKSAALAADWALRTGGAGPDTAPKKPRSRCTVKGCRGGMVTLSTKVHSTTGKTSEVKIPCGVCHRRKPV